MYSSTIEFPWVNTPYLLKNIQKKRGYFFKKERFVVRDDGHFCIKTEAGKIQCMPKSKGRTKTTNNSNVLSDTNDLFLTKFYAKINRLLPVYYQRNFSWICHQCREPEVLPTSTRIDLHLLRPEECPKLTEELLDTNSPLILNINCRSIMNKIDELKEIIYKLKPLIICLTETWMDYSVPQNYIVPEGYNIIRNTPHRCHTTAT